MDNIHITCYVLIVICVAVLCIALMSDSGDN